MGVFGNGIKTTSFKRPALEGYIQMVQIKGLLSDQEVGFCVQGIDDLILSEDLDNLRSAPVSNALPVDVLTHDLFFLLAVQP